MHTVSKTAAETLGLLIEAARTSDSPGYLKLDRSEGNYMPLTIERVGDQGEYELWSLAHYYTQNGDAMRDPEIVFAVPVINGKPFYQFAFPVEWTQDGAAGGYGYTRIVEFEGGKPARYADRFQKGTATFCTSWMRNLKAQQRLATLGRDLVAA
jgi:hypothetical protein